MISPVMTLAQQIAQRNAKQPAQRPQFSSMYGQDPLAMQNGTVGAVASGNMPFSQFDPRMAMLQQLNTMRR
jgi:hypothetical protein